MTRQEAENFVDGLTLQSMAEIKIGLSTREIYLVKKDLFEIHDFIDGWNIANVNKETLIQVICGEKSLLDLDWI